MIGRIRTLARLGGVAWALAIIMAPESALAQTLSLDLGDEAAGSTASRLIQLFVLLTVLSLAPSILVMVTSFTRIVVVLSFLRRALGIQQTPPISLLIMMPTLELVYDQAIQPLVAEEITEFDALD